MAYNSEPKPTGDYRTEVVCKENHTTYIRKTDKPRDFNCGKRDAKGIRCGFQVY
mgnify:CR=1 FL=1